MGKGSSGLQQENQINNNSSEIPKDPKNIQQEKTENRYLVGGGKEKSRFSCLDKSYFSKRMGDRNNSGTINAVNEIISMHDLTIKGVEGAIKDLMKK